jgi:hypothetical protein
MEPLNIHLVSLLCAVISGGLFALQVNLMTQRWRWILATVLAGCVYLISLWNLYMYMPNFQGVLFGLWWPTAIVLCCSTFLAIFCTPLKENFGTKFMLCFGVCTVLFLVPAVQLTIFTWGPYNALKFGQLARVSTARADETIPPTDPNRIVLVDQEIAAFKGQTALATTSQYLGSRYRVSPWSFVLQAVKGHRYWIAPLQLTNFKDTFINPLMGVDSESEGYVVVDAQDPDAKATVRLGYHMTRSPGAFLRLDLYRELYLAGFYRGALADAKFEVDDDWQPHWVVSFLRNQFGDVGGAKIEKVLVVDVATNKPKINVYEPADQPTWIERTMPESLVMNYTNDWGMYNNEFARSHPWQVWLGTSLVQSTTPTEADLNYTTDNQSVYVIPMTSVSRADHAVTGIMVYDTNKNDARYYPGVRGFNTASTVQETISHAPIFLGKNLQIDQIQLYSIYGELTWLGIVTNPQAVGRGFAGIALLHAYDQNASEVVFAPSLDTALAQYRNQLAHHVAGGPMSKISRGAETKEIAGKVTGIGIIPGSTQQPNVWILMVGGDNRTFAVTRDAYAKIPMVHEGDTVKIKFLDIKASEQSVSSMKCARLDVKDGI